MLESANRLIGVLARVRVDGNRLNVATSSHWDDYVVNMGLDDADGLARTGPPRPRQSDGF